MPIRDGSLTSPPKRTVRLFAALTGVAHWEAIVVTAQTFLCSFPALF